MQRSYFLVCSAFTIIGILFLSTSAMSYEYPRSSIRFNFGVWDITDDQAGISVYHNDVLTEVEVLGISGAISFSHMVSTSFAWEFSLGGFSNFEAAGVEKRSYNYETFYFDSRSVSVSYALVGLIYYPLNDPDRNESGPGGFLSFLRPYFTAGMGPYFGYDAWWDEDDIIDSNFVTTMGVYPGMGFDLFMSKNFIFNIDVRYHFVEFSKPLKGLTKYNGPNVVAGIKIGF